MGEGNDCDRKLSFCYGSCLVTVVSSLLPVSPCSPVILSHHVPRALRYAPVSLRSTIPGPLLSQPVGYSRSLRASPTAGRSAGMVE